MIPIPLNAQETFDREFLPMLAKLLEVAATLDRIERSEGEVDDDPRMKQFREALSLLAGTGGDYAERFQMVFSLPYSESWREQYEVA
jgi:hypothetical protein